MTPNKFFIITLGLGLTALPFCLFTVIWYDVQPFVTASFELFCGLFVANAYCKQPEIKKTKLMHLVVGVTLSLLITNMIDGLLFSMVSVMNHGAKDHIIAQQISVMWENYIAFYILFSGIFSIITCTWLMVYVTLGDNKFCR